MFTDFFFTLKRKGVPVTLTEWMTLMQALSNGYISNLEEFYFLARAILVKSETFFDPYDLAFQEYFQGIETPDAIRDEILDWLKDPENVASIESLFTEEEMAQFDDWDLDELMKELEKRLEEQNEQHDGGGYWIGRGGTSPF
ncbi:MAG: VWA containing CoxE family protein, partial [Chloroflexi bacterium]|nr:VWA containing CoxE family protein [Chloroflexota bacterium]